MQSLLRGASTLQKESLYVICDQCSGSEFVTASRIELKTFFFLLIPLYVHACLQLYILFMFWRRQTSFIETLTSVTTKLAERGIQHTVNYMSTSLSNLVNDSLANLFDLTLESLESLKTVEQSFEQSLEQSI